MQSSRFPAYLGFGVASFFVLAFGNQTVTDELVSRSLDNPWLRSLLGGSWRLTTDGRPFDLYVTINSFAVVYVVLVLVLLRSLLAEVTNPVTAFAVGWGATTGAGLCAAVVRGLLAVVTDNQLFARLAEVEVLDSVSGSVDAASSYVIWSGLMIGVAVAIGTAVARDQSVPAVAFSNPPVPGGAVVTPDPSTDVPLDEDRPVPPPPPPTGPPADSF